jgi:nucleoside 2-deoxyribosyltransferase
MSDDNAPGRGRSVFLAGPFKALVDPETGNMRDFERMRYESLIGYLEQRGYTVHNAHKREDWGANFLEPEECTRLDWEEIDECDLFVAFPGHPASPGTHIEIGWASARRKPMLLLLGAGDTYAFLVRGLHVVADVTYVEMPTDATGLAEFARALLRLEDRLGWRGESDVEAEPALRAGR